MLVARNIFIKEIVFTWIQCRCEVMGDKIEIKQIYRKWKEHKQLVVIKYADLSDRGNYRVAEREARVNIDKAYDEINDKILLLLLVDATAKCNRN